MKVILLLLVAASAVLAREIPTQELTAYGYLVKYGIPEAERIRKAEEMNLNSPQRIVGGIHSDENQHPHQAGLLIDLIGFEGRAVCGASVISAKSLLTAAHCWSDGRNQAWQFTVVLGSITLFTGGIRITTSEVIVHPEWTPSLLRNDVAIAHLPISIEFSDSISPIALPSGDELNNNFAGHVALASGFGLTATSGSISSNQALSHVNLNVITNSVCNLFFFGVVQPSNICTSGAGGRSTCSGDSGGPLIVEHNGRNVLIGVVSFGIAFGCEIGWPASYARVTSFIDFVNEHKRE